MKTKSTEGEFTLPQAIVTSPVERIAQKLGVSVEAVASAIRLVGPNQDLIEDHLRRTRQPA